MVLTGISVGDYRDPGSGMELGDLMCEIARVPGVERVRLSSVEVIHVKDSLVRALAREPKVCPHLHIPLQSGDDEVLRAMGRHYTAAEYLEHVGALREQVPAREPDHGCHRRLPDRGRGGVRADAHGPWTGPGSRRVHTFSYSPRPGTAAERLGDRVSPAEKKRRSQAMRGRSEVRSRVHRSGKLGTRERVLVDKVADTQCSGYTSDYTRCYLPAGGAAERGELVDVVCLELHADGIAGGFPEVAGLS